MPKLQATVYDAARVKLTGGGLGAQLKMLHHIRSVSVHPAMEAHTDDAEFIDASARLRATIEVLRSIRSKGENALVTMRGLTPSFETSSIRTPIHNDVRKLESQVRCLKPTEISRQIDKSVQ